MPRLPKPPKKPRRLAMIGADFRKIEDAARAEYLRSIDDRAKRTGRPKKGAKSPLESQAEILGMLAEFAE